MAAFVERTFLDKNVSDWSNSDVSQWLRHCEDQYGLQTIQNEVFSMNGKALCMLRKEDFQNRVPLYGDLLFNILQTFQISGKCSPTYINWEEPKDLTIEKHQLESNPIDLSLKKERYHQELPVSSIHQIPNTAIIPNKYEQYHNKNLINISPVNGDDITTAGHKENYLESINAQHNAARTIIAAPVTCQSYVTKCVPQSTSPVNSSNSNLTFPSNYSSNFELNHDCCPESQVPTSLSPNYVYQPQCSNSSSNATTEYSTLISQSDQECGNSQQPLIFPSNKDSPETNNRNETFPVISSDHQLKPDTTTYYRKTCYTKKNTECTKLLWEFLYELLREKFDTELIRWVRQDNLIFRIANPDRLALLWGKEKNRNGMNYDKLARALRYYYRVKIIEKVRGKRLTYRFLKHPEKIIKGQRGAKPGVPHKSRKKSALILADKVSKSKCQIQTDSIKKSVIVTNNVDYHEKSSIVSEYHNNNLSNKNDSILKSVLTNQIDFPPQTYQTSNGYPVSPSSLNGQTSPESNYYYSDVSSEPKIEMVHSSSLDIISDDVKLLTSL